MKGTTNTPELNKYVYTIDYLFDWPVILMNVHILMYTLIYKKSGAEFIFIQTKGSTNTPVYNKYVHTPDPTSYA